MICIINKYRSGHDFLRSDAGLTLIELLIAMAVSTIVLAIGVSLYAGMTKSFTTETVRASVQQDVRGALDLMVQDIRMAGLDPEGTIGAGFIVSSANDIEFTADLNVDGLLTAGNNERIRYFLSGTRLMQRLDDDPDTDEALLDNVSTLNFEYLFEEDAAVPSTVVITLAVQSPAGRQGVVTRTLTERVRVRNL